MSALLRVENITRAYCGQAALSPTSLRIDAGERIGIAGASAAGKSTLARLLALHERPDTGEIRLREDCPWTVGGEALRRARRAVQLVLQEPGASFVARWPVWRVVAESALIDGATFALAEESAIRALESVQLDALHSQRSVAQLSGGERRRVAIARALLARPDVLILDESFSGLDPPRQRELLALLEALPDAGALAILTISHDLRLLRRFARRALIMHAGGVVEDGPAAQVLHSPSSAAARSLCAAVYESPGRW